MPYLLRDSQEILIIDYNARNGLFYQSFRNRQANKSTSIMANAVNHYSAVLDNSHRLHIVCKNLKHQILLLSQSINGFDKEVLLDDSNNTFEIGNLFLTNLQDSMHLFYCATNPTKKTSELIHHVIAKDMNPPQSLATIPSLDSNYDIIVHKNKIYLLVVTKDLEQYNLVLRQYDSNTQQWGAPEVITSSILPLQYARLTIDKENFLHVLFVEERYGQYQIHYCKKNNLFSTPKVLHVTPYPVIPTIFRYHDSLWINWVEANGIKMICSVDQGEHFSSIQNCSLPNSKTGLYHFIQKNSLQEQPLVCNYMYATETPLPRLAIISMLDMDGIHPDLIPNKELALYLNTINIKSFPNVPKDFEERFESLEKENQQLKTVQNSIMEQYEQTASLARQIQEEGKKWRTRCLEAENLVKKQEKKLQKLSKETENTSNENSMEEEELQFET